MENLAAVNLLYVESRQKCQRPDCEAECIIMDILTGTRFCAEHAPKLWLEKAFLNQKRLNAEIDSVPSPCVIW